MAKTIPLLGCLSWSWDFFNKTTPVQQLFGSLWLYVFFDSAWDRGKDLAEQLQTSMLQFLKDPIGFPQHQHTKSTKCGKSNSSTLGVSAEACFFQNHARSATFWKPVAIYFFWFGTGPGEASCWTAPSSMLQFLKDPIGFPQHQHAKSRTCGKNNSSTLGVSAEAVFFYKTTPAQQLFGSLAKYFFDSAWGQVKHLVEQLQTSMIQ